jgi:hypothetical protein
MQTIKTNQIKTMNNYYEEEETGHACCQHSESFIEVDGFTVETFIEETAQFMPYGAFIKGFGTKYGKSTEEATARVVDFAKSFSE